MDTCYTPKSDFSFLDCFICRIFRGQKEQRYKLFHTHINPMLASGFKALAINHNVPILSPAGNLCQYYQWFLKEQRLNKPGHFRSPTHTHTQTHISMHALSGFLFGCAILSLCSGMRRQWVQCGETGFAPVTLQNIPLRDRWLAGWMVSGKQAKQQTTPALHNSYREKKNPL